MCDGIHMQKTATLIALITTTVPHLILLIVRLCSAIKAMRLMMICLLVCVSLNTRGTLSVLTLIAVSRRPRARE